MRGLKCIRLREFSVTLLFVLSLASSLALSFFTSQTTDALAPINDPFASKDAILDFVTSRNVSGFPSKDDLKGLNWAVGTYEPAPDTFLFVYGDDDHFGITGGDSTHTNLTGHLCRWNKSLNGGPGCNPLNQYYSLDVSDMSQIYLTPGGQTKMVNDHPEIYFAYQEIILSTTRETIRPDIKVEVDDKHVKITDKSGPPDAVKPYRLHALATVGTFETQIEFHDFDIDAGGTAEFDSGVYQPSSIEVYYTDLDGTKRQPSTLYDYRSTIVTFRIDGKTFTIDTTGSECDTNDLCTQPAEPEYEDCFQYGTDLIRGFTCIVGNIGKFLGNFFSSLFTPDPKFTRQMVDLFKSFMTNTYGLTAILSAPFSLLSKIQEQTYNCSTIQLQVPHGAGNIGLPCMTPIYQQRFGSLFTTYQVIVTAVISYYVILGILVQVKNMKDPENDRIEAHQL